MCGSRATPWQRLEHELQNLQTVFFDLEHELGKHDKYDNEDDIIYNE